MFFEQIPLLSKNTEISLKSAGIIRLGPDHMSVKAVKAIDSTAIDTVILGAAAVVPVIALLEERATPFVFAIPPTRDSKSTAGFVLSDRNNDLWKIGISLFPLPSKDRASIH